MRVRIQRGTDGGKGSVEKEVRLSVIRAGLNADGTQRHSTSIRFGNESWKKASDTDYVAVEIDRDEKRLYFVTGNKANGFKLVGSKTVRTVTFSIHDVQEWNIYKGEYNLLKDVDSGDYYIDLKKAIPLNIVE